MVQWASADCPKSVVYFRKGSFQGERPSFSQLVIGVGEGRVGKARPFESLVGVGFISVHEFAPCTGLCYPSDLGGRKSLPVAASKN